MTKSQELYHQLIHYDFTGYIDPFENLGTFDKVNRSFKEPVDQLVNPYTKKPYSHYWQTIISAMRELYSNYQKALHEENLADERAETTHYYLTTEEEKKAFEKKVTTYLSLGFNFSQVAEKVNRASASLRENFKRSELIAYQTPCFFNKEDLSDGFISHHCQLPLTGGVRKGS
ncbi:hypothetical protein ACVR1G_08250 [Streptococcus dentasini]